MQLVPVYTYKTVKMHVQFDKKYFQSKSRGYDSVIRRMNILVCSGMDFMCALSTFALELEDK